MSGIFETGRIPNEAIPGSREKGMGRRLLLRSGTADKNCSCWHCCGWSWQVKRGGRYRFIEMQGRNQVGRSQYRSAAIKTGFPGEQEQFLRILH